MISHFCFLTFNLTKNIPCHGQYMKNFLASKGYLPWRIELYLFLCYSCQVCMVLSKVSCKIESSFVLEIISKSNLSQTISVRSSNLFLRELMLIWPIITWLEFFNLTFCNTLFVLFASLEVFLFRMLLDEIHSQFFVFNNWQYVCSIFPCVWASK